ncbi:MAG: lamin tail domain-containing protein, partial [Planctomycetales bacterium]|nr:lamin tail domain-containing protein [Planctomycetales bacterium]
MLDSTVVFNELMYNPPDGQSEWLELHNQMAVDIDLSNWSIDGIDFRFPNQTRLAGGEYLVIAEDPARLGIVPAGIQVFGPYGGRLDGAGERLRLLNISDRVMDELTYSDRGDWPDAADGSGLTLAKRDPQMASAPADNWTHSAEVNGTPGSRNFVPFDATPREYSLVAQNAEWRYQAADAAPSSAWRNVDFNDANWPSAPSVLYAGQFPTLEPPADPGAISATSPNINNPSFELNSNAEVGYGQVDGWNAIGTTGINPSTSGQSPFADNGQTPDGRQIAFIQGRGSLSQTITGLEIDAEYQVELHYNARNCCGATPTISVSFGGQVLLAPTNVEPVEGTDYHVAIMPFTATAESGQLLIRNVASTG